MEKKYELTNERILLDNHILYRIKALKNFSNVKAGDLGGFVESEKNLSQEGNCWIYNDAASYEESSVQNDACLYDTSVARGKSLIVFNSVVYGNSVIEDEAIIGQSNSDIILVNSKLVNKRSWINNPNDNYLDFSEKIHAPIMEQIRLGIRNGMDISLVKKNCSNNFDWDDVVDIREYDALLTSDDYYDKYEEQEEQYDKNDEAYIQKMLDSK